MKVYYCSKCERLVWPTKTSWIDKIMFSGDGERFCRNCGTSTKTATEFLCVNGHNLPKDENFCEKCGRASVKEPVDDKYANLSPEDDVFVQKVED